MNIRIKEHISYEKKLYELASKNMDMDTVARKLHTALVFSPGQDSWHILPDKGVGFHH